MNDFQYTIAVLAEYADALKRAYETALVQSGSFATSDLYNSIEVKVKSGSNSLRIEMSLLDYWKYIEYGRKPGSFPPVDAIIQWISVKNIIPEPYQLPTGLTRIPTENQLAYLFGRKIEREGIEAKHLLEESNDKIFEEFRNDIQEALAKDFGNQIAILLT